jgi:hypothetical protein
LRLSANWELQRLSVPLGGNLASFEARALVVAATVEQFPSVELAFAWTRDIAVAILIRTFWRRGGAAPPKCPCPNLADYSYRNAPLILGHMNFFLEFEVCFYRHQLAFELSPK